MINYILFTNIHNQNFINKFYISVIMILLVFKITNSLYKIEIRSTKRNKIISFIILYIFY